MRQAARLQGAARDEGLRRARPAARPRRRAARADRRPQRGDARLGARRACMLRRPGLVLTTVCLKRRDVTRRSCSCSCLAILAALAVAALPARRGRPMHGRAGSSGSASRALSLQAFDHVDPALAYSRESWTLLDTVCARLMRYRDTAAAGGLPDRPRGRGRPPDVSRDGRTTGRSSSGAASASATASPVRAERLRAGDPPHDGPGRRLPGLPLHAGDRRRRGRPRRAGRPQPPGSPRAATRSSSASPARSATSTPGRRCRSSAPSRPTLPPEPRRASARFPGAGPYTIQRVPARTSGS